MRIASWEFNPSLWPTLATILVLPLFLSLGFWQLDRAEEKRRELMEAQPAAKQSAKITALLPRAAAEYRKQIEKGLI